MMVEGIKTGSRVDFDKYEEENNAVKQHCRTTKENTFQEKVAEKKSLVPQQQSAAIHRKVNTKSSIWLTIVPTHDNGFSMSANEFQDAFAIRYGRTPFKMRCRWRGIYSL